MNGLRWQIVIVGALLLLAVGVLVSPVTAQGPGGVTRDQVNEVARELYCPLCTGLSVDVCEIQVCQQMRDVIAEKLAAGESKEQIKAYFVEQYGQKVLAQPEKRGVDLIAWILPGIVVLGGLGGAALWLRRRAQNVPPAPAAALSPESRERLERELKRLDS
ncbi:MAG: cytochrome c-type biogenesis protein CcmH [Ardenticatenaceae bacterium]|nr:cytochrome c-type biogenesis protein CcmH [Ardenticatenaceae bacterium]